MENKVIHYCWFGRTKKNRLIKRCIDSWKKFCPEYTIIEWSEGNFNINCCEYVQEAYRQKKWAFVSDYCRFYVLEKYGGIYLDTDVELVKKLDDLPDCFVGFEDDMNCNSGLVRGAIMGDAICKEMLESYHSDIFMKSDGSLNLHTVCERETKILQKYGLATIDTIQIVRGTTVYPKDYFNPYNRSNGKIECTKNTYSIHHYASSWVDTYSLFRGKTYRMINRIFGYKLAILIQGIFSKKK